MKSFKVNRIAEDIKRELSDIFKNLKDPRVNASLVSILHVDVTNELSYAKIYITSLDGLDAAKTCVEGLVSAKGYIKHELSKKLEIRKIPELNFYASDSIEFSSNINEKLKDL